MKQIIRQIIREVKEYLKYLEYKYTLSGNPMHDDIYIVAFPKSGVTWLSFLISNIELQLLEKEEKVSFYNHHKYVIDVHQLRSAFINRKLNRTFIKSHVEYNPYYYFIIYLIRNPFDVMVSYFNFMRDLGYKNSFSNFVKDSEYGIEKWKNHVNSWLCKKNNEQKIHFIRYEDIISNPRDSIKNMYENLGLKLNANIMDKAVELSSLQNMKKSEEIYRKFDPNYSMSFVGKDKKISKEDLLSDELKSYIYKKAAKEIGRFYPEYKQ